MKNRFLKLCSLFLTIVMLVNMLPMSINPQARSYYAKVAHNMGGKYVFKPLLKSLGISAVGSAVVTTKNRLVN